MQYFDPETSESYVPFVVETSIGVDRMFLQIISAAYTREEIKRDDGEVDLRVVLRLPPALAPVKLAVLPLVKKDGLPDIAMNIYKDKTKYGRVWITKDNKSMYFAFKNDGKIEYKKDLDFDDLTSIKHKPESDNAILKSAAAVLTFDIGEEVELELPKRPPKAKREGYR